MSVPTLNPYRPPDTHIFDLESERATDEELLAFAGARGDYYLAAWQRFRSGRIPWSRLNIAAFFLSNFWCFYRRMFAIGMGVFVAGQVIPYGVMLIAVWLSGAGPDSTLAGLVYFASFLAYLAICGAFANYFYYLRAVSTIGEVRRITSDPLVRLERIRRAGGTSGAAVLLGSGAIAVGITLVGLLAMLIATLVLGVPA